jgi:hypothetical protein
MATKGEVLSAMITATSGSQITWHRTGGPDSEGNYTYVTTAGSYTLTVIPRWDGQDLTHTARVKDEAGQNIIDQDADLTTLYTTIEAQHSALESAAVDELAVILGV